MATRRVPDLARLADLDLDESGARAAGTAEAGAGAAPAPVEFAPGYVQLKEQKAQLERLGIANPYFSSHEGVSGRTVCIAGRSYLNYAGYNYLGLSGHPE